MKIVIDANILFSAFIRERSDIRKIILSSSIELYSPEWILEEFERNQGEMIKKMDNKDKFLETKELLFSFIKIIPKEQYEDYLEKSQKELKENRKDVPYIALCLCLGTPLWSNDLRLKNSQKLVKVLGVSELLGLFEKY
ncbi:MAG: PIN domain-containing protein [Candidatus Micrarchaeota archaeon]|nr:PIN domain-containing protein [Candidatus Micrarchaeota archaeon]